MARAESRRGNAEVCPNSVVIPGRRAAANPESITTIVSMDSGLAPKRRAPEWRERAVWNSNPPMSSRTSGARSGTH